MFFVDTNIEWFKVGMWTKLSFDNYWRDHMVVMVNELHIHTNLWRNKILFPSSSSIIGRLNQWGPIRPLNSWTNVWTFGTNSFINVQFSIFFHLKILTQPIISPSNSRIFKVIKGWIFYVTIHFQIPILKQLSQNINLTFTFINKIC